MCYITCFNVNRNSIMARSSLAKRIPRESKHICSLNIWALLFHKYLSQPCFWQVVSRKMWQLYKNLEVQIRQGCLVRTTSGHFNHLQCYRKGWHPLTEAQDPNSANYSEKLIPVGHKELEVSRDQIQNFNKNGPSQFLQETNWQ